METKVPEISHNKHRSSTVGDSSRSTNSISPVISPVKYGKENQNTNGKRNQDAREQ
jgi:hypothetical protein